MAQLELLRSYGSEHDIAAGEVLFADGDLTYDLIVVLAGGARIIERRGQPGETVIATYGQGQFLGEIGLTGQRAYLSRWLCFPLCRPTVRKSPWPPLN